MQKIEIWKAEDGKYFEIKEECIAYENKLLISVKIAHHLEEEFCFAIGYSSPESISRYIVDNLEKFGLKFKGD